MKYYIPTSSLNLDNILQAECISPRSFYAQRKNGYKSIELIDAVKKYNQIVLFNHPISFSIEDPGRYNYPLLIEIEDDIQLKDICDIKGSGMYLCNYTIYLTPKNCVFYFFTENAYKLTTINTKSNKSIKFYNKYTILPSTSPLILNPLKVVTIKEEVDYKNNETIIDKQKGICYAFLKGQSLSITPKLAHLLKISQELYNTLTGIISNSNMRDHFQNNLESLLKEYKSVDPIELRSKEKFENNINAELGRFQFLKSCLIDILEKWEVWDYVFKHLSLKWECESLPNVKELSSNQEFIELRNKIENHTNDALKEYQKRQPLPTIDNISINKEDVNIKDMPIINKVVNYIIKNQLTTDCLSANRQDICLRLIKGVVIEEVKRGRDENYWDSSMEKKYFNALYSHMGDVGKPFNLRDIDNMELMVVAAFLLRGHDISALMAYLKSNEIYDYRYILVLWGALCGYMEMNKEFLSDILTLDNYKNVYECMFHNSMGELKHSISTDNLIVEKEETIEEYPTTKSITNPSLKQELSGYQEFTSRDEKIQIEILTKLSEVGIYSLADWDDKKADSIKWTTKKGQKKLVSAINKSKQKNSSPKTNRNQSNSILFTEEKPQEGTQFYKDKNALSYLAELLPEDKKIRNQFKTDIEWFQENHNVNYNDKSKGISQGIYYGKPIDNKSVIERFEKYLDNKRSSTNPKTEWLRKIYQNINISGIISKLKESYI